MQTYEDQMIFADDNLSRQLDVYSRKSSVAQGLPKNKLAKTVL